MGNLAFFGVWNVAVVLFIMYRLRSNDLDELEKEAQQRLRLGNSYNNNRRD